MLLLYPLRLLYDAVMIMVHYDLLPLFILYLFPHRLSLFHRYVTKNLCINSHQFTIYIHYISSYLYKHVLLVKVFFYIMSASNAAVNDEFNIKFNIRSDQIIIILCRSTENSNTLEDVWYSCASGYICFVRDSTY